MIQTSLRQISNCIQGAVITKNADFKGISIDSRTLEAENLFVAIEGENFDGHNYIEEAESAGAVAVLVNKQVKTRLPRILVLDTIKALGEIAKYWREHFSIPLIAITGSNGKTSVKEMIAMILQKECGNNPNLRLATKGNLNTEIGVPLNLFRLNAEHRYAVLEAGMNAFKELYYLSEILQPKVAVITNAGPAHLEYLGTVAGVAKAKGEIFHKLQKTGCAVLNADDEHYEYWRKQAKDFKVISFGISNSAEVFATEMKCSATEISFVLYYLNDFIKINLSLPGRHNVLNALAAAAACLAIGINLKVIKEGLEAVKSYKGRLEKRTTKIGAVIIDDSYNANLYSLDAALTVLASYNKTKILVLGDMKELGKKTKETHVRAGKMARQRGVDYLLALGENAKYAVEGFGIKRAMHFSNKEELLTTLLPLITKDSVILIKGSRTMKMETIVEALLAE